MNLQTVIRTMPTFGFGTNDVWNLLNANEQSPPQHNNAALLFLILWQKSHISCQEGDGT